MVQTIHELFAPVEHKGGVEGIMQHINTGIAVYDGVRTGIKIMQRIRGYFLKKRNNLVLTTTFYPHEKTATRCGGNFVVNFTYAQDNPLWMRYCAISPDGTTIAFTYKGDIYTVPSTGGRASQITTNPAHDTKPIWSPDGKKLLSHQTEWEVWIF